MDRSGAAARVSYSNSANRGAVIPSAPAIRAISVTRMVCGDLTISAIRSAGISLFSARSCASMYLKRSLNFAILPAAIRYSIFVLLMGSQSYCFTLSGTSCINHNEGTDRDMCALLLSDNFWGRKIKWRNNASDSKRHNRRIFRL